DMRVHEKFSKKGARPLECVQPTVRTIAGAVHPVAVEFFQTSDSCDGRTLTAFMTPQEAMKLALHLLHVVQGAMR
ncbi:hypothetical protein, partial [Pseudomonas aeruginosa]|uniref:hypothetical protein n=3 Tax=Pseudomonas aeruginosa TaxID=287 RepID=UPI001F3DEC42